MKHLRKFETFAHEEEFGRYDGQEFDHEEEEMCPDCGYPKEECPCPKEEMNERKRTRSKPDFLDLDKDGNRKESMRKASRDVKKGRSKRGLTKAQSKLPPALQAAIKKGIRD